MVRQLELPIQIIRKVPPETTLPFTTFFKGFERVQAVRSVFGEDTDAVLGNLKVGFISLRFMYMGIRDEDGSIGVGTYHLRHSDLRTLYLDIVHELFHVKQWQEDRKYFGEQHRKFMRDWSLYYASPIEVPAYKHTVREAERIGMSRDEIVEHLKMGPVPPKVFAKFVRAMELGRGPKSARQVRLPVKIDRKAPVALFPFTEYFKGFEKVASVRTLFGERTDQILDQLKVEFVHGSFIQMIPSDEDGHLLVSVPYLKNSASTSIYLDVLVCLNMVKRASEGRSAQDPAQREFWDSSAMLESYKAMVKEASRIGMPDAMVLEHLNGPRFLMSPAGYERFLRRLGFGRPHEKSSRR
ncbi:MAG: hypothetical protein ACLQEQ_00780 [Nitrososphaerales archaeon]